MVMKRSGAILLYRAAPPAEPSAATDALILSAARARRVSRLPAQLALAAALAMMALFVARWMTPGGPPAPEIAVTNFGAAEGQAHAWLVSYQPVLTATGPGSQEGRP